MAALANYCDTYRDFDPAQLTLLLYVQPGEKKQGRITYHKLSGQNWLPVEHRDFRSSMTKATLINIIKKLNVHACSVGGGRVINEEYLLGQLAKNQIYLILFDERNKAPALEIRDPSARELMTTIGSPISFLLSKVIFKDDRKETPPIPRGEVYIDIICSCPGAGRHLLHFMDQYATANHNSISLSSLPNVLLYYPTFGFTHRLTCYPSDDQYEVDARTLPIWQKKNQYARFTSEQLYDDDEFSAYMSDLQEKLYGDQDKDGCKGHILSRLTPAEKKQSIKDNRCGNDGYRMRKCMFHQTDRTAASSASASASASGTAACNGQKKGSSCVISGGKKY
jgi:hypothetical protein